MKYQTLPNEIGPIVEYVSGNREDVTGIFSLLSKKKVRWVPPPCSYISDKGLSCTIVEKLRREKLCFLKIDILSTLLEREYDFLADCHMKVCELQVHSKKSNSLRAS